MYLFCSNSNLNIKIVNKNINFFLLLIFSLLILFYSKTSLANSNNKSNFDYIIAKPCFFKAHKFSHVRLAKNNKKNSFVLAKVSRAYWQEQLKIIKTNSKYSRYQKDRDCGMFLNVNQEVFEAQDRVAKFKSNKVNYEAILDSQTYQISQISKKKEVTNKSFKSGRLLNLDSLYSSISAKRITAELKEFSDRYNRASFEQNGVDAAKDLKAKIEEVAKQNNLSATQLSVNLVSTLPAGYEQPSVVVKLSKASLDSKDAIVIGGHLDTLSGRMPGADDNGSGSMVVLETAKVLLSSKSFIENLNRPVYFIWYAAEEMGLVGSKLIVRDFKENNINVHSALNFDTVGRRVNKSDNTVFFLTDNVDREFTQYLQKLATVYVKVPVKTTKCGYSCSDHASWNRYGFVSAAGFESAMRDINPDLHSVADTTDNVSIENLVNFTKLAVTYAVDIANNG